MKIYYVQTIHMGTHGPWSQAYITTAENEEAAMYKVRLTFERKLYRPMEYEAYEISLTEPQCIRIGHEYIAPRCKNQEE